MNLDIVIAELRSLNEPVPKPARLPTPLEVQATEAECGVVFPESFRHYLLKASDVVYGVLEPVTITIPGSHTDFKAVYSRAKDSEAISDQIPVCEDNGNFYLMNPDGSIVFWSHSGTSDESWPNLATWIKSVWIDAN